MALYLVRQQARVASVKLEGLDVTNTKYCRREQTSCNKRHTRKYPSLQRRADWLLTVNIDGGHIRTRTIAIKLSTESEADTGVRACST